MARCTARNGQALAVGQGRNECENRLEIGLKNVVAYVVSRLILLLEQGPHVGDSIQLGNLQGEIRDIRGRANTIRTWDGTSCASWAPSSAGRSPA